MIAQRIERFLCHEQTTAIAEPSPIPDCTTVWPAEFTTTASAGKLIRVG